MRPNESLLQPLTPNLTWSMDFMHDVLNNGVKFRTFNVIDDFNREGLNITLGTSITSRRVIRELERLIEWRGKPEYLRVDNGPEFIAQAMENWAIANHIDLKFIPKGKPHKNGYVERFNRSFREEVLDSYLFDNIRQAQLITNAWLWSYNNEPQSQVKEFPTFQQDIKINLKSLVLNATN